MKKFLFPAFAIALFFASPSTALFGMGAPKTYKEPTACKWKCNRFSCGTPLSLQSCISLGCITYQGIPIKPLPPSQVAFEGAEDLEGTPLYGPLSPEGEVFTTPKGETVIGGDNRCVTNFCKKNCTFDIKINSCPFGKPVGQEGEEGDSAPSSLTGSTANNPELRKLCVTSCQQVVMSNDLEQQNLTKCLGREHVKSFTDSGGIASGDRKSAQRRVKRDLTSMYKKIVSLRKKVAQDIIDLRTNMALAHDYEMTLIRQGWSPQQLQVLRADYGVSGSDELAKGINLAEIAESLRDGQKLNEILGAKDTDREEASQETQRLIHEAQYHNFEAVSSGGTGSGLMGQVEAY